MTLAEITDTRFGPYNKSIDCAKHGTIQEAYTETQAKTIAHIHNLAMHPRTYNRKLNKKK